MDSPARRNVYSRCRAPHGSATGAPLVTQTPVDLHALARRIRRHVVRMVFEAKSGHIGGSLSATDILTVLYASVLRHDPQRPDWPARDRFVMSKGHCTPVQYAVLAEFGYLPVEELATFRRAGSRLQGHSVLGRPPGAENSAGSLGMGLSFGLGIQLAARVQGLDIHSYVLMGDGEQDEGQVWEAAMAAAHHRAGGLVALIDRNGIQNDDFTAKTMSTEPLDEKYRAFGWTVRAGVDGHDLDAIVEALRWARDVRGQPTCVIFDTIKGKGVSFMQSNPAFHGAPPTPEQFEQAMRELADGADGS
ncbi:MAG: transketolase [Dehalococcoidia bacterium]|nr:transketolase [Dehalococcoidia bacterium]